MRAFVVLCLVFPYQGKRLAWGNAPKWPILCWVGRKTTTESVELCCNLMLCLVHRRASCSCRTVVRCVATACVSWRLRATRRCTWRVCVVSSSLVWLTQLASFCALFHTTSAASPVSDSLQEFFHKRCLAFALLASLTPEVFHTWCFASALLAVALFLSVGHKSLLLC